MPRWNGCASSRSRCRTTWTPPATRWSGWRGRRRPDPARPPPQLYGRNRRCGPSLARCCRSGSRAPAPRRGRDRRAGVDGALGRHLARRSWHVARDPAGGGGDLLRVRLPDARDVGSRPRQAVQRRLPADPSAPRSTPGRWERPPGRSGAAPSCGRPSGRSSTVLTHRGAELLVDQRACSSSRDGSSKKETYFTYCYSVLREPPRASPGVCSTRSSRRPAWVIPGVDGCGASPSWPPGCTASPATWPTPPGRPRRCWSATPTTSRSPRSAVGDDGHGAVPPAAGRRIQRVVEHHLVELAANDLPGLRALVRLVVPEVERRRLLARRVDELDAVLLDEGLCCILGSMLSRSSTQYVSGISDSPI